MRKSELIERISNKEENLSISDVTLSVDYILDYLADTFSKKGRIEIRGFGNLTLQYQPPREAHNPKTKQKVHVPGKHKIRFKMGKELKESLNLALYIPPAFQDAGLC